MVSITKHCSMISLNRQLRTEQPVQSCFKLKSTKNRKYTALQIYTTTLLLFYFLKDVLLQPNEATNIGCTLIQLLYNCYATNSSIYYNILYEQLIFVKITAIFSTWQVCTSFLQLKRCTLSLSTAG